MSQERRKDRVWGLLIVGSAFLAGLCISWWARGVSTPSGLNVPAPPTADGVLGFPRKVETVANLDRARQATKRGDLRYISVVGVSSDGTVDVSIPIHYVRYGFGSSKGEGPQPPRPPGTLPKHVFCGKQSVRITEDGMGADADQPGLPCSGMGESLPNPRCGPREVWKVALGKGMPASEPANIDYYRSVTGPAWRFEQPASHRTLILYGDCERELSTSEGVTVTP